MKDIVVLLTSLTLVSGISWFFFSKDKKKEEENQESGELIWLACFGVSSKKFSFLPT